MWYLEDVLSQTQWLLDWTLQGHHAALSFGHPKGITRKAAAVVEKKCDDLLPCMTLSKMEKSTEVMCHRVKVSLWSCVSLKNNILVKSLATNNKSQ